MQSSSRPLYPFLCSSTLRLGHTCNPHLFLVILSYAVQLYHMLSTTFIFLHDSTFPISKTTTSCCSHFHINGRKVFHVKIVWSHFILNANAIKHKLKRSGIYAKLLAIGIDDLDKRCRHFEIYFTILVTFNHKCYCSEED